MKRFKVRWMLIFITWFVLVLLDLAMILLACFCPVVAIIQSGNVWSLLAFLLLIPAVRLADWLEDLFDLLFNNKK